MSQMTPREIVQELDKHIIGQSDAKRAVAIALRNRWRRMQVEEGLRQHRRILDADQAAAGGPGNLVENLRAGLARTQQQRLDGGALPVRFDRGGVCRPPVRLAVREQHDDARRAGPAVALEFA